MHARVSTYRGSAESIERSLAQSDEIAAVVRAIDGSRGLIYLIDRASGKSLSITLWDSTESMQASEEAADRLRRDSSESAGETIEAVERYEVSLFDVAAQT
ncbi:MAG: hypothetical protein OEV60_03435 [Actinomycetota bacterium]|nr:hypothetical protein [Actinomycetota bacterium]MDH5224847.1 hypothetical protein [Actinomycetota bacterium]MDH5312650.1 hypothetical protein [Actinomycetota bacterium]